MALDLMGTFELDSKHERIWALVVCAAVGFLLLIAWDPLSVDEEETTGVVVREIQQVSEFPSEHEARVQIQLPDGSGIVTFLPLNSCRPVTKDMEVHVVRSRTLLFKRLTYRAYCAHKREV